jgi:Zn-dependent membrane protease YugP
VFGVPSVSATSVACHEAGHALQHAGNYFPLTFRNSIVPVVNIASRLSWVMILIGIVLLFVGNSGQMGTMLLDIGIIAFVVVIVFHLVTLPVEFNASSRALQQMEALGLVTSDDMNGSRKVLRAAAFTYVAAALMAIANLLRILAIVGFDRD